jgi:hypothetical protein
MKTKQIIFLGLLGLSGLLSNAQTIATSSLTSGGLQAGNAGTLNTFYGYRSGKSTTSASGNVFIGNESGLSTTTGNGNFFGGNGAGIGNINGSANVYLGEQAGESSLGNQNVFIGSQAGAQSNNGIGNVYIGNASGIDNSNGNFNTFIGADSGIEVLGSNNVFIGVNSGPGNFETVNNKLFISSSNNYSQTPLIWGDFANDQLKFNAKVGVGYGFGNYPTTAGSINVSNYNMFVKGGILTEEVRVSLTNTWADYVFKKDYKLPTLQEVEKQIQEKGHLFNVPSAQQVKNDGIELGEMAKIQQEKIEELTLYIIQQNKEIELLKTQMQIVLAKK